MNKRDLDKVKLLKAMNFIIKKMNDEAAYSNWIYIIPDQASEDELEYIAIDEDDEIFNDACMTFVRQIAKYGKSGFFLGDIYKSKLYGEVKGAEDEDY